jgi:putative intracellular protease/amidase
MKIRQVSLFIAFFIVNNQKMKDMITIAVGLANGFEEMEALVPVDVWRRAGYEVLTISVTGDKQVTGSHGITVIADKLFQETDFSKADMIFLPGECLELKTLICMKG